jgi:hypothetical protein
MGAAKMVGARIADGTKLYFSLPRLFVGCWQLGRWQGLAHAPEGKTDCNLRMAKDTFFKEKRWQKMQHNPCL